MMLMQQLAQRALMKAVNAEADIRILIMIKDWNQREGSSTLLTLLRLPAPPLHLVTGPVQLFKAVLAAEEAARDDDEHDAGTAQRMLYFALRNTAIPAGTQSEKQTSPKVNYTTWYRSKTFHTPREGDQRRGGTQVLTQGRTEGHARRQTPGSRKFGRGCGPRGRSSSARPHG